MNRTRQHAPQPQLAIWLLQVEVIEPKVAPFTVRIVNFTHPEDTRQGFRTMRLLCASLLAAVGENAPMHIENLKYALQSHKWLWEFTVNESAATKADRYAWTALCEACEKGWAPRKGKGLLADGWVTRVGLDDSCWALLEDALTKCRLTFSEKRHGE